MELEETILRADFEVTDSETRLYPNCLFWFLGTNSLWRNILLSLDKGGEPLVLSQSNVLDFVDSPWKPYPF